MEIRGVSNISPAVISRDRHIEGDGSRKMEQEDVGVKSSNSTKEERIYTEEELIDSIESANETFIVYDRRFEFSIHEGTKHIMVKVIDTVTDEVIREIPAEKILDLVGGLMEISGILVDERI